MKIFNNSLFCDCRRVDNSEPIKDIQLEYYSDNMHKPTYGEQERYLSSLGKDTINRNGQPDSYRIFLPYTEPCQQH